jgi:hypothetical protein
VEDGPLVEAAHVVLGRRLGPLDHRAPPFLNTLNE